MTTTFRIPRKEQICQCSAAVVKIAPCILHASANKLLSLLIKAERELTKYDVEKYGTVTESTKDMRRVIELAGGRHKI